MIRFRGAARVAAAVGVFYCVSSESSDDVIVVVVTAATHVDTYEIAAVKIVSPLNFCSIFFFRFGCCLFCRAIRISVPIDFDENFQLLVGCFSLCRLLMIRLKML